MLRRMENGYLDSTKWTSVQRNGLVWLILILGGLVRALGALHDLPYTYFGDEEHFIRRSMAFGSGDLNPHWFHKPAFYMYWLFFEYGLYFLVGTLFGWFGSASDFAQHFFATMEPFILIGRLTTVAFSVATIYLTYRIGTQYLNRRVGLLAAFFLALCVGNFSSSIVVKADIPATFFAMLSLFFIFSLYQKQRWPDYLWAGLFAGIGTATKYYPIIMLSPIFVAHALAHWEKPGSFSKLFTSSKMMGAVLAWGVGFFLCSPYNFLDPTWIRQKWSFIQKLHTVGTMNKETGLVTTTSGSLLEKLWSVVISLKDLGGLIVDNSAMGFLVGSLALAGLLLFLLSGEKSGNRKGLICFAYVLSFALVVSVYRPSYASSRHLSMLFPMLCIAAATVVEFGWSRGLAKVESQKWKNACMVLVSFFFGISECVYHCQT